jgi:D-erythro-7,8-dihydroneopterin triphosphate epimerase
MDRILIEDLRARCIIGINSEERREKQEVRINVTLHADLRAACRSDRFEDTVDYRAVKKEILVLVEQSQFHLVEALAQAIADICLSRPAVRKVKVRVDKPLALRFARSVAVEIIRSREDGGGVRP